MSEHMQQDAPSPRGLKGRKPKGAGGNFIYLDGQMHFHTEECKCAEKGCECKCDQYQQIQAMLAKAAAIQQL